MKKHELKMKTNSLFHDTRTALQMVYDTLNKGQQKKLLKDAAVAELFERYGVKYGE